MRHPVSCSLFVPYLWALKLPLDHVRRYQHYINVRYLGYG